MGRPREPLSGRAYAATSDVRVLPRRPGRQRHRHPAAGAPLRDRSDRGQQVGDLTDHEGQVLSTDVPVRTTAACADGTLRLWLRAGDQELPDVTRQDLVVVAWVVEEL